MKNIFKEIWENGSNINYNSIDCSCRFTVEKVAAAVVQEWP